MTTEFPPIDLDKSPLCAVDEEAIRLADILEDHPDARDVAHLGTRGDVVFTTAAGTRALNFQAGPDGEVFQDPTGTPAGIPSNPAADVLCDIVVPALLAEPAYQAATADGNTLTVHLATGRHYTLALSPAA
ncbi:hypothetical protein ABZ628_29410 [Streptomyces diastaticus]|uniref:hypothetical protein n=1 Tax=Streptomyces diastaticus TaxID=1956 RepID=UPI003400C08E